MEDRELSPPACCLYLAEVVRRAHTKAERKEALTGLISFKISRYLPWISMLASALRPVMFPSGRDTLETIPKRIGSPVFAIMGIVVVASRKYAQFRALVTTITLGFKLTNSRAISAYRSVFPSPNAVPLSDYYLQCSRGSAIR